MVDKFLQSKNVKRILSLIVAISLLLGLFSATYPSIKRSEKIAALGGNGVTAIQSISTAFTSLAEQELKDVHLNPRVCPAYKKLSGVLARVSADLRYHSIYMVYKGVGGKYYTLLDSRYRDNAVSGVDYFAPGAVYEGDLAQKSKSELNTVYSGKLRSAYEETVLTNEKQEKFVLSYSAVYSSTGEILGALICQIPADNTDFSTLGLIHFPTIALLCFMLAAVSIGTLIGMKNWRSSRELKAKTKAEAEKQAETAKQAEAAETAKQAETIQLAEATDTSSESSSEEATSMPPAEPSDNSTEEKPQ